MPAINIPKEAESGFRLILDLGEDQIKKVSQYLNTINATSTVDDFYSELESLFKSSGINKSQDLVLTIAGFIGLARSERNYQNIAHELSASFKELYSPELLDEEYNKLKSNLEEILKSTDNLQLSSKANSLKTENVNIYKKSKVISDIRLIFKKDIEDKSRQAVLVHDLHITYRSNSKVKNFFVTMDLEDLKALQIQIERAILKDKVIQEDYPDLKII